MNNTEAQTLALHDLRRVQGLWYCPFKTPLPCTPQLWSSQASVKSDWCDLAPQIPSSLILRPSLEGEEG